MTLNCQMGMSVRPVVNSLVNHGLMCYVLIIQTKIVPILVVDPLSLSYLRRKYDNRTMDE